MAIRQKPSEHRQCNAERVVSAALREGRQFCVHAPCVCVRRKIEEDDFDGGCGENLSWEVCRTKEPTTDPSR